MTEGLGLILRERRLALGLRTKQVAADVGVSPAMVSMVEAGKRPLPSGRLMRWLRALRLTLTAA